MGDRMLLPALPLCERHPATKQVHFFFFLPFSSVFGFKDPVGASLLKPLFQGLKTPPTSFTPSLQSTCYTFSGDFLLSRCPEAQSPQCAGDNYGLPQLHPILQPQVLVKSHKPTAAHKRNGCSPVLSDLPLVQHHTVGAALLQNYRQQGL